MSTPDLGQLPELVHPPSRRFVLRRYTLADAPALERAVTASLDHLLPFLPFAAAEPLTLAARREIITRWEWEWHENRSGVLGMFRDGEVIGSTGLHRRRDDRLDVLEIGYWVHVDHVRQGIATESTATLTDAAFRVAGTRAVEILHAPANTASRAIPHKLGYRYIGDEQVRGQSLCVWRITADDWSRRPPLADQFAGPVDTSARSGPIRAAGRGRPNR